MGANHNKKKKKTTHIQMKTAVIVFALIGAAFADDLFKPENSEVFLEEGATTEPAQNQFYGYGMYNPMMWGMYNPMMMGMYNPMMMGGMGMYNPMMMGMYNPIMWGMF